MTQKRTAGAVWSTRAVRDLEQIADYIARDDREAGRRWVNKLKQTGDKAAYMPLAARIVPEFQRNDIREVFLGRYRIVYIIRDTHILVLTVFFGGRRFPYEALLGASLSSMM